MLFRLFYELALSTLALTALPHILYQRLTTGKYRDSLLKKFGVGFPSIKKNGRPLIWIHAVSVGETKAVAPLVKLLKKSYNNPLLIISSTTETGHAEAKRSIPCADYHLYLPLDFTWIIRPILKQVRPDLVLLTETDFWYNFLQESKALGAKIVLVNGKLSEKSSLRFRRFQFFTKKLFDNIDLFCIQSQHYVDRFLNLGVPKDKIVVTGNLKLDNSFTPTSSEELEEWKQQMGIPTGTPVLVVGSTHAPEEEEILATLDAVWKSIPDLKVVIVPRHPERFDEVASLIAKQNISFTRLSACQTRTGKEKVFLIDTMGLLTKCYQFADVAIVAGSYTPHVGGHNIIEPCCYGIPTLYGPHMHSQPELVDLVSKYKSGLQVPLNQLSSTLVKLLNDNSLRSDMRAAGLELATYCKGATLKTCSCIEIIFAKKGNTLCG